MYQAIIIVLFLIISMGQAMADGIFISSHNASSDRFAILDELDQVAYLYLCEKGKQTPIKDAIAYMRISPPDTFDYDKQTAHSGQPPLLAKDMASENAVIKNAKAEWFSFRWSADGNSVALLYNGQPIAFVSATMELGYSKAVAKPNKIALPWDDEVYKGLFGE